MEGELRRGLARFGIASAPSYGRLEAASRTDRGVSARGNVLALTTALPPDAVLRALNGVDPAAMFTAARRVPDQFRVRGASRRVYRYFEAPDGRSHDGADAAATLFAGDVDVRSLGRGIPGSAPHWRTIESVRVAHSPGGGRTVEVRAPAFVWGEVRKIVAALREVDAGRLPLARLGLALEGKARLTLPLAPAEPLVLWEVEYDQPWTHFWAGPNRRQRAYLATERERWWSRSQWLDAIGT